MTTTTTKFSRRCDDNVPLCPGNGASQHQKRRYKATLIIRTVEPTPLDLSHSKESLLNFVACVVLTLPTLLHYSGYAGEVPTANDDSIQSLMEASLRDRWVPWAHLAVLVNGAFAPVLHLLSDDVLCGLGLEILNKICDSVYSATNRFDIGEVAVEKNPKGVDNVGFDGKDDKSSEQ